jgi:hypothetical protein
MRAERRSRPDAFQLSMDHSAATMSSGERFGEGGRLAAAMGVTGRSASGWSSRIFCMFAGIDRSSSGFAVERPHSSPVLPLTAKLLYATLGAALPALFRELNCVSAGCGLALSVIAGRNLAFPPELRDSIASGCTHPRGAQTLRESGTLPRS